MRQRAWKDQEVELLKKKVKFDEFGFVSNTSELAGLFDRAPKQIASKVELLRKKGVLPTIYYDDPLYPIRKTYSDQEDKFIVNALKSGAYAEDIAKALDRSTRSIYHRIAKLREKHDISYRLKRWSKEEDEKITTRIKFDQYGYLANVNELMHMTGRSRTAVYKRVELLRKTGAIEILPDRSHASEASKAVFGYYYQIQTCSKQKETTPVPASVDQQ